MRSSRRKSRSASRSKTRKYPRSDYRKLVDDWLQIFYRTPIIELNPEAMTIPFSQPSKGKFPSNFFSKALDYYTSSSKQIYPYMIDGKGTTVTYVGEFDNRISPGTFAIRLIDPPPQIVNFYMVKHGLNRIRTFRFGTPVFQFHEIKEIVKRIYEFSKKEKEIICISLLSPCNSIGCRAFGKISKTMKNYVGLMQKGYTATLEDNVIRIEQRASSLPGTTFHSILFPLSNILYKNIPFIHTYVYDTIALKDMVQARELKVIYDKINVTDAQSQFESIVRIAHYYYTSLQDRYELSYHCKSGKDRTGIFDAIVHSTFYYIYTTNVVDESRIDYEFIRNLAKKFLYYGLVVAFYSTGVIGLKLKNIPIARYIFHDELEILTQMIGHSDLVQS
jgi:hypothetical protein